MTEIQVKALAYDALMAYFNRTGKCLSLAEAVKVVGGEMRLATLVSEGKVEELDNKATKPNCKRRFRAADVFAHVRTYKEY